MIYNNIRVDLMSELATAKAFFDNVQYARALETVVGYLKQAPSDRKALKLKAAVCTVLGQKQEAIETYKNLIFLHEIYEEFWDKCYSLERIGSLYWQLKDIDSAIEYYKRAVIEYEIPYNFDPDGFSEPIIQDLLTLGEYQIKSGRIDDAITTYKKLLGLYSEYGPLEGIAHSFYELALIYYRQSKFTKATTKFLSALKLFRSLNDLQHVGYAHYYIGYILFAEKKFKDSQLHIKLSIRYLNEFYRDIYDEADPLEDREYRRAIRLQHALQNTEKSHRFSPRKCKEKTKIR